MIPQLTLGKPQNSVILRQLAPRFAVLHSVGVTTARAIIFSALLIAVSIGGAAWYSAMQRSQDARADRYQLANTGSGSTVRLDRQTGDMITCRDRDCAAVVKGGKIAKDEWAEFPAAGQTKN